MLIRRVQASPTATSNVLNRWQREMDDWFSSYVANQQEKRPAALQAPISVYDEGAAVVVELDLPGVARQDLQVNFDQGILTVTAERQRQESDDRQYLYEERPFGKIARQLNLPETVEPNSIEAELTAGVLRIKMAKKPELKPRQIEVKES